VTGCVILASERGEVGLVDAMAMLRSGASAMDAVEAAIRAAESNLEDHYVGVGGIPNLAGELELDASIMDGRTRAVGAVAAVRGYPHPISIARRVLEQLPQHVLLVGAGAERFAAETGFEQAETITDEARLLWRERLHEDVGEMGPGEQRYRESVLARLQAMAAPDGPWGTVNVLARDAAGHLCVGVSTSGYPWKYPGRVGDSALIGAGNYCDDRIGGAACTGRGEMAIRGSTALRVLYGLSAGSDPTAACVAALRDAASLEDQYAAPLQTLVLCPDGRHAGATTRAAGTYAVFTEEMSTYEIVQRSVV
jgi:isoaspartyl peptidase/L-asparaginase-like protein (Ntn-hydrolase superfamily)